MKIISATITLTFILCTICGNLWAQANTPKDTIFTIKGRIVDSASADGIPYATVALLKGSSVIKTHPTLVNGTFSLNCKVTPGKITLAVSCVGYTTKKLDIDITSPQMEYDLGNVPILAGINLAGVTVTGVKPLVSTKEDRVIYSVENDPDSEKRQMVDILRKIPLLSVSGLDQVSMNGSTNFKVLVNGRHSSIYSKNFSQMIKALPASSVKEIEVITNPSTRYDADGIEGVINIIMKKTMPRFLGVISGGADTYSSYMGTGYFALSKGKFSTSAILTYKNVKQPYSYYTEQSTLTSSQVERYMQGNTGPKKRSHDELVNVDASYDIDKYNLLTFNINNYSLQIKELPRTHMNEFDYNGNQLREYYSEGLSKSKLTDLNLGFNYQHLYKNRAQHSLTFSYEYTTGIVDNSNIYDYDGVVNYQDYGRRKQFLRREGQHTFQLDYFDPFRKNMSFEAGAKYILCYNRNSTDIYLRNNIDDPWNFIPEIGDNLDYTRHVIAAYGGYSYRIKQFNLRAGVRIEGEIDNAMSLIASTNTDFNNNYLDIVPNIQLGYKRKTTTYRISYAQSLRRPGITLLNPYVDNSDPEHIFYGNPGLKSVVTHKFNLGAMRNMAKWNINVDLISELSHNQISQYTFVNDNDIYESTYLNQGNRQFHRLSLSAKYYNKGHAISLSSYAGYYKEESRTSDLQAKGWRYNIELDCNINIYPKGYLFLNTGYNSRKINLQRWTQEGYFNYHLGLRQDLLKGKLNLAIYASNPFNKHYTQTLINQGYEYNISRITRKEHRVFALSVSYRFSTANVNVKRTRRSIENESKITNEEINNMK